jgi:hypothetical protein
VLSSRLSSHYNRAAHQSGTSFSPRRLPQLTAGDDQHSKIWRGGGAEFGGYRFGPERTPLPSAWPRRRAGSIRQAAISQAKKFAPEGVVHVKQLNGNFGEPDQNDLPPIGGC